MNHFYQQTHRLALRSRIVFLCLLASLATLPAFAQTSWQGTTNSDWNTATNWSAGVPTAISDVTIPNVTNKPIIGAATTALAKSVEVQSGAVLTISSSATLAVNGTNNVPGSTAFLNFGTVHNNGQLNLGNTASTGEHGLSNGLGAIFNNNAGGTITIDRSTVAGLWNGRGTFTNAGGIIIGATAYVGDYGLVNSATFNNNAGGTITIDRSGFGGLDNRILTQTAIFTNAGGIIIGATENVGHWGLRNTATFNNQAGGTITSDRSTDYGLQNVAGTFTNAGGITIGVIESVGANGIQNAANFANNGCTGIIRIVSNSIINNFTDVTNTSTGNFTNSGTIIENATGNSNISSNSGLVQNLNGGAFNIGSGTPATTSLALIWTGCTSTDWNTASNWNLVRVTTATDDVVIPNVTNKPIIGGGTSAVAKSVKVESGASLTILATGSLTINGSGGTYGLGNFGTVVNSGSVIIGNTAAVGPTGLVNYSTFSNNAGGTITIDRSTDVGFLNTQGGTITNAGGITIGATAAVGLDGLVNQGTFSNHAGGTINLDRSTRLGLFNQAGNSDNVGIFTNAGVITIGAIAAVGDYGLLNGWIFNNNAGGTITIDRSTNVGLSSGGGRTFTNAGGITIGVIAAVGANGIQNFSYFYNNGCTGIIRIVSNSTIDNQGIFTNSGTISENATGNSNISSNSGLVQNLNGGTFTIPSNTGLLTTALTTNLAIAPAPSLTINTGQTATLTASGAISYLWSTGETTASISVSVAGPYSVTGTTGSCSATATVSLIVNLAPPIITSQPVGPTMVCLGGSVSVPVGVTNATSFQWITSTTPGSVQMAVAGQTSATLTLTNLQSTDAGYYYLSVTGPGGSTVSNGFSLMPIQPPLAFIAANPSLTITQGQSTMLTASGAQNFLWSTGDTSPAIPVSVAGPYSVTVSASGSGCFGSKTVIVTVLPCDLSVGVTPSGSTLTCTTPTVSLTASGGGTYRWNDNSTSAIRLVNSAGTYSVTVTSANGCTASASATITEDKTPPTLNLTASRTTLTCTNPSATLTASGAGTFQWSNTTTDATLTVSAAGLYSVTLTGANGCISTASLNVNEDKAPPTLNLTASRTTLTCTNPSAALTASGAGAVRWSDNSTSPTLIVSAAGLYSVTLTGANGCTASASATITEDKTPPTLNLTASRTTLTCTNPSATLTASGAGTFQWSNTTTDATLTVSAAGLYSVTLTGANGCISTASLNVNEDKAPPTLNLTASRTTLTCTNPGATLTASGAGTFQWSNTTTDATLTVSAAGLYSVTLTGANGCISTASLNIVEDKAPPTLNLTASRTTLTCANPGAALTASGAGTVRWSDNSTSPTLTVNTAGLYSVTLTGANGCSSTVSINVNQDIAAPTLTLTTASSVCEGQPISLLATAGLTNYSFSGPGTFAGSGNTRTVTGLSAGLYSFTVTATQASNGCSGWAMASVKVNTTPGAPTLTALSRTVMSSTTPLSLLPFVQATSGNTLGFSATSGVLNPPNANVSTAGVQNFSVTQVNGSCVSPILPFSLTVLPTTSATAGASPTVCRRSSVVLTVTATGLNLSYRWLEDNGNGKLNELTGSNASSTNSLTLTNVEQSSDYYCRVTGTYGTVLVGPIKLTVNRTCTARVGVEEPAGLRMVLAPNPLENGLLRATVRGAGAHPLTVQLYDIGGYIIGQQSWEQAEAAQIIEWNVATQPAGLYVLRAVSQGQQQTVKVVKP